MHTLESPAEACCSAATWNLSTTHPQIKSTSCGTSVDGLWTSCALPASWMLTPG